MQNQSGKTNQKKEKHTKNNVFGYKFKSNGILYFKECLHSQSVECVVIAKF